MNYFEKLDLIKVEIFNKFDRLKSFCRYMSLEPWLNDQTLYFKHLKFAY